VSEDSPIQDDFPNDHLYILYSISDSFPTPWFANIVNYLVASVFPPLASKAQTDKIKSNAKHYIWWTPAETIPHKSLLSGCSGGGDLLTSPYFSSART